ncbi:hypothetical protein ACIBEA_42460 [Streptomyces sp. NPDC051555]|uniref:hypothetical protein n=1 Tax=Streptomyces sp. NPDC051555 TaxID=3365657 RepID=UPI0037B3E926
MSTDRRQLGTGPAGASRTRDIPPAPRARLAADPAEVTTVTATTAARPGRPTGRRTLGTGPTAEQ